VTAVLPHLAYLLLLRQLTGWTRVRRGWA
jgi:hypothetical protein